MFVFRHRAGKPIREPKMDIEQQAPDFTLPRDGNGEISLSSLKGSMAVLYFYPKDNTPGCTKEAIAFCTLKKEFDSLGIKIIGISKDSVRKHDNFKAKHDLNIILASDENGEMIDDYGVWVLKKLYGREYMGIERATYLLDKNGKVLQAWRKVRVKGHAEAVLEAAKSATV